jgi:hypothetical protein
MLVAAAMTVAASTLGGCSSSGGPGASTGEGANSGAASSGSGTSGMSGTGIGPASGATSGASMASGSGSSSGAAATGSGTGTGAASGASGTASGAGSGSAAGSPSGSGAGSGSGAASGSSEPDGGSALVQPIQRGNLDVYEFGDTTFTVDGTQGARITSFTMGTSPNVLSGPAVNAQFWGGTFWTAPQGDWWTGMVPPNYAPIDYAPYTMTVGADSSITAVGATATFATPAKMVAVTKTFSFDPTTSAVLINYSMANKGTASIKIGHWELARVLPGGLTFYPAAAAAPVIQYGMMTVQKIGAYEWFDETTFPQGGVAAKSVGDAAMGPGWIAHVVPDPAGPLVLIRSFAYIPVGSAGTGDGAVEIFMQADGVYEEIEIHNALLNIAAGASAPWPVSWMLRRLPAGTAVTAGSQALVNFVLAQLQ